jgi:hypothetical protein
MQTNILDLRGNVLFVEVVCRLRKMVEISHGNNFCNACPIELWVSIAVLYSGGRHFDVGELDIFPSPDTKN